MNEILIDLHRKLSDFARQQFPESRSFEPFESPLFEDFGKQLEQWPDMRDAIREQAEISGVSEAFRLAIYPYKTALSSTEVEEFMSGTT